MAFIRAQYQCIRSGRPFTDRDLHDAPISPRGLYTPVSGSLATQIASFNMLTCFPSTVKQDDFVLWSMMAMSTGMHMDTGPGSLHICST